MGPKDDQPTSPKAGNDLLDELESIRGLLDDSIDDDEQNPGIDIPILDDVVPPAESPLHADTELLDLEHIFDEPEATAPEAGHALGAEAARPSPTSPLAGMSLDDLELTEFGLEGLDLDELDIGIEIPDFKLQAEISDPSDRGQPTAAPLAASGSPLLDDPGDFEDLSTSLADDLALLDDDPELWLEDDPVADAADNPGPTQDDHQQPPLLAEPPAAAEPPIDLEFLIQDIVDDFIPRIEDQLRRRLSACSAAVIQQLAEKHLKK